MQADLPQPFAGYINMQQRKQYLLQAGFGALPGSVTQSYDHGRVLIFTFQPSIV